MPISWQDHVAIHDKYHYQECDFLPITLPILNASGGRAYRSTRWVAGDSMQA